MHKYFPKFFIFLDKYDNKIFQNNNTNFAVIYRNYGAKKREIELQKIAKACKASRNQLFVSNDIKLTYKVKANGIYIPSFNRTKLFQNLEKRNIKVIGSAHNQKEIRTKIIQKCSMIFLSPFFYVEKSKKFLGLHKFNFLSYANNVKILPLGGISEKNKKKLKLLRVKGFGGIRIFKKKPAY